jgi:hypothetical protein
VISPLSTLKASGFKRIRFTSEDAEENITADVERQDDFVTRGIKMVDEAWGFHRQNPAPSPSPFILSSSLPKLTPSPSTPEFPDVPKVMTNWKRPYKRQKVSHPNHSGVAQAHDGDASLSEVDLETDFRTVVRKNGPDVKTDCRCGQDGPEHSDDIIIKCCWCQRYSHIQCYEAVGGLNRDLESDFFDQWCWPDPYKRGVYLKNA